MANSKALTVSGKAKGKVVSKREAARRERYEKLEKDAASHFKNGIDENTRYWHAILQMYEGKLWDTKYRTQEEWVGNLTKEAWGPSRAVLFASFDRFKDLKENGLSMEKIAYLLGSGGTSIRTDAAALFDKEHKLLPEVAGRLKEKGTTLEDELLDSTVNNSGSERRQRVSELTGQRRIYCHEAAWVKNKDGSETLLAQLVETGGGKPNKTYNTKTRFETPPSDLIRTYMEAWVSRVKYL